MHLRFIKTMKETQHTSFSSALQTTFSHLVCLEFFLLCSVEESQVLEIESFLNCGLSCGDLIQIDPSKQLCFNA